MDEQFPRRNSLSKEAVAEAIRQQAMANQQGAAPTGGLLGLLGRLRDPIGSRARMEYNEYASDQMSRGMPALPFEEWRRQQQQMMPAGTQRRGLLNMP